jgi:hypothetical protein
VQRTSPTGEEVANIGNVFDSYGTGANKKYIHNVVGATRGHVLLSDGTVHEVNDLTRQVKREAVKDASGNTMKDVVDISAAVGPQKDGLLIAATHKDGTVSIWGKAIGANKYVTLANGEKLPQAPIKYDAFKNVSDVQAFENGYIAHIPGSEAQKITFAPGVTHQTALTPLAGDKTATGNINVTLSASVTSLPKTAGITSMIVDGTGKYMLAASNDILALVVNDEQATQRWGESSLYLSELTKEKFDPNNPQPLKGGSGVIVAEKAPVSPAPATSAPANSFTGHAPAAGSSAPSGGTCAAEHQRYDIMFGYNNTLKDQISGCKPGDAMCMYQHQIEAAKQLDDCVRGKKTSLNSKPGFSKRVQANASYQKKIESTKATTANARAAG